MSAEGVTRNRGTSTIRPAQPLRAGGWLALASAVEAALLAGWFGALAGAWEGVGDFVEVRVVVATLLGAPMLWLGKRFYSAWWGARSAAIAVSCSGAAANPGKNEEIVSELLAALGDVQLFGASTVPGQQSALDVVGDLSAVSKAASPWDLAVRIAQWFAQERTYRVDCRAAVGPGETKKLCIEAHSPTGGHAVTTLTGTDWAVIAREAAWDVVAFVLPHTRLGRTPPWTAWHGQRVDPEALRLFHRARGLQREERLEESLEVFDQALAADPPNPYIRLERAAVLDQLGLHIDALAAYVDVVYAESLYDPGLLTRYRDLFPQWRSDPVHGRRRSPNGPNALLLARYRMVCSLSASKRLADQWGHHIPDPPRSGDADGRRHAEAVRVLNALQPLLVPYSSTIRDDTAAATEVPDATALRRALQYAALIEGTSLAADYRWRHPRRWRRGRAVSTVALRFLPPWALLQYRFVEAAQAPATTNPPAPLLRTKLETGYLRRVDKALFGAGSELSWPPACEGVQNAVNRALRVRNLGRLGLWSFGRRRWQEYYNAACTFAVTLGHVGAGPADDAAEPSVAVTATGIELMCCGDDAHERLARLAEHHLEHAVTARDFPRTDRPPAWWHRGDQDLDDLRPLPPYRNFIERYVDTEGAPLIPPNVAPLTMSLHVTGLALRFAELRRDIIRVSGASSPADEDEHNCWAELLGYCQNWRSWQTRAHLIHRAQALADASPHETVDGPVRYEVSLQRDDCQLPENWAHRQIPAGPPLGAETQLRPDEKATAAGVAADEWIEAQGKRLADLGQALWPIVGPDAVGAAERIGRARSAGPPLKANNLAGAWDAVADFLAGEKKVTLTELQATLLQDPAVQRWEEAKARAAATDQAGGAATKRRRIVPTARS